jgi:uncharacterized phage-like protein YoqJ
MNNSVFFTGHRIVPNENIIRKSLEMLLQAYISAGYSRFITGMATGLDQLAAEVVINLREVVPHIQLIAAIPFVGQERVWPDWLKTRYQLILSQSNEQHIVCEGEYAPWKMQVRNKWMVDNAYCGIAYWNGATKGGTWNCLQYARTQKKHVNYIQVDGAVKLLE